MGHHGRESWSSELGLMLSLIGVAVGLGNVWRFPYMLGKFGGAGFLAIYLLLVLVVGVPGLIVELTISRYARKGPFEAFAKIGVPGGRILGYILLVIAVAAVAYYMVVIGWVLWYLLLSISGALFRTDVDVALTFESLTSSFQLQVLMHILVVAFCVTIVCGGIRRGIELASKLLMPIVYAILAGTALYVIQLPGSSEGLLFYLRPDLSSINWFTVLAAMGQVFFSLGLGSTWIFIYGSYMSERQNIVKSSFFTAFGDTMASFIAGIAILPLVFIFRVDPSSGPPLMFITLPEIFRHLPVGTIISSLFFMGLLFAAVLSAVPGFEIFIDAMEKHGLSRRKAAIVMGLMEILIGIPSMLSIDILLYNDLFWGSTMLPLASLFSIIAFGWVLNKNVLLKEVGLRKENLAWKTLYYWVKLAMPIIVILILIQGWISWFSGG